MVPETTVAGPTGRPGAEKIDSEIGFSILETDYKFPPSTRLNGEQPSGNPVRLYLFTIAKLISRFDVLSLAAVGRHGTCKDEFLRISSFGFPYR
jgi:hypothetical protein